MAETLTRKVWVKPTRKLTKEEIDELVRDFDYEGYLADFDEDADPEPSYDEYGNPSRDTLAWLYEREHGLTKGGFTTMEEFRNFLDEVREEADAEMEIENAPGRLQYQVQA